DEIAREVLDENILSTYKSEQDLRDALVTALQKLNMSKQEATDIASHVNVSIGGPQAAGPLYDPSNTTGLLSPRNFFDSLITGFQDFLGLSPTSNLGDAIAFVSGINTTTNEDSFIGAINRQWYNGSEETRSYLNPTASDATRYAQLSLGDPAVSVREW